MVGLLGYPASWDAATRWLSEATIVAASVAIVYV